MIHYKTSEEIEFIRISCSLVADTLAMLASEIKPGTTTLQLDRLAEEFIHSHNGVPAFKGFKGFPNSICTSRNEVVVHGIPNGTTLLEGDTISIDCGAFLNGWCGDSAYTFALKGAPEEVLTLMRITKQSLMLGVAQAVNGHRIGDISSAIQQFTQRYGYGVVRELVGHGLGKGLHEKPEVPNFGKRGRGPKLREGMVIAIEPMINMGTHKVYVQRDGWTIVTKDGLPSAHFEHTVAVKTGQPDILSTFRPIEEAIKNNRWLQTVE